MTTQAQMISRVRSFFVFTAAIVPHMNTSAKTVILITVNKVDDEDTVGTKI